MSKTEKYLPYLICFLLPGLGYINNQQLQENALDRNEPSIIFLKYLAIVGFLLLSWHFNKYLFKQTENFKNKKIYFIIFSIISNIILISVYLSVDHFVFPGMLSFNDNIGVKTIFFRLGIATSIFVMLQNVFATMRKSEQLKVQNLSLQSESLKAQLEMFKQQINPHFLFNSLNTLIDLIEDDKEKAVEFVRHFSKLYRFVLTSSKSDLVTLDEELNVLENYWKLLKMRFDDGISLSLNIDPSFHKFHIPPLSLQLLIENAVKHNIVSENEPLEITIYNERLTLIVENKLIPKEYVNNSTGMGLKNLSNRFNFTLKQDLTYGIVGNLFKVELPLKTEL